MGCSGVHSFPNNLHCAGLSTPLSTSPHCAALGSVTRTPGTEKRFSASHSAYASRMRSADCEMKPMPRHSKYGRSSKTSADGFQRRAISFPRHHALVLIFHFRLASSELPQQHHDALQNIYRFKAGDDDRLAFVPGDPFIGPASDHGGDVPRADERVDAHVGRIENRADGGNDRHVIARKPRSSECPAFWLGSK